MLLSACGSKARQNISVCSNRPAPAAAGRLRPIEFESKNCVVKDAANPLRLVAQEACHEPNAARWLLDGSGRLHAMDTPPKDTVPLAPVVEPTLEQKAKAVRAVRLAAALRTNLKRRKAPAAPARPAAERN